MPEMTSRQIAATEARFMGFGADRSVNVLASNSSLDAHGTCIDQSSWSLTRFKNNPVILYGHDHDSLPIGYADNILVDNEGLRMTIHFASADANPLAEQVWKLVSEKCLRAVSVGFIPGEGRVETRGTEDVVVLSGNELLEVSVVPIPSNGQCIAKARKRAFESKMEVEATAPEATEAPEVQERQVEIEVAVSEIASEDREVVQSGVEFELKSIESLPAEIESRDIRIAQLESDVRAAHAVAATLQEEIRDLQAKLLEARASAEATEHAKLIRDHAAKLTPALEAWAKDLPLETLRSFLNAAPTVHTLSASFAKEPAPKWPGAEFEGKSWDQLEPIQKARLFQSNREHYDALKAAHTAKSAR